MLNPSLLIIFKTRVIKEERGLNVYPALPKVTVFSIIYKTRGFEGC